MRTLNNLTEHPAYFFVIKESKSIAVGTQQILHHLIVYLQCRNFEHEFSIWVLIQRQEAPISGLPNIIVPNIV